MAEPWEDNDTSTWDTTSQGYSTQAERDADGQTLDEDWEYYTDEYGYTKADTSQMTGYTSARKTEIKRIQTALQRASFNPGTIDGIWGPKTCSAMLAFQKSRFGSAKAAWLDIQTWTMLDFDMSTSKRFEDLYGRSCGGTPPPGWDGAGSGTNVIVSASEIQKIQYALGVLTTGKFDKATCEALYKKQAALGVSGAALTKRVFETLGFTTSDAQKIATQLGAGCAAYYKAGGSTTPTAPTKPTGPTGPTAPTGPTTPTGPVKPQTASMGLLILGGMLLVGIGGYIKAKGGKKSRKGRR